MLRSTVSQLCSKADPNSRLLFHTSAATLAAKKGGKFRGNGSSRTRLTNFSKNPGSRAQNLEVAPKREFPREAVPHADREPARSGARSGERSPSFRRGRYNDRSGKWTNDNEPRKWPSSRDSVGGNARGDRPPPSQGDRPRQSRDNFTDRKAFTGGRDYGDKPRYSGERPTDRKPSTERKERISEGEGWEPWNRDSRSRKPSGDRKNFSGENRRDGEREWREPSQYGESRYSGKPTDKKKFVEERSRGGEWEGRERRDRSQPGEQGSDQNSFTGDKPRTPIWKGQRHLDQDRARQQDQYPSPRRDTENSPKPYKAVPIISELSDATTTTTQPNAAVLATQFTSPPLLPGILSCLTDIIGPGSSPTPIQALSLKWLLNDAGQVNAESGWKQFLLASETGSGKSIAYLLPVLQNLKLAEINASTTVPPTSKPQGSNRPLNPRALIMAPTHELSRQLASFAKSLLHEVKLRVLCASRANMKSTKERDATARQMVSQVESHDASGEFVVKERSGFPVDVVVGTPMKLLEMVRGRGWDRKEVDENEELPEDSDELGPKPRRGRDKMVGFGKWRSKPEMGLANVEWVVVDEADVLFDPDFQETTRQLLADISEARGYTIPPTIAPPVSPHPSPATTTITPAPLNYPFNLILTSATIPASLSTYLDTHHPKLMRLASPRLHHLPKTLQTEYVNWSGGNKLADIERRVRRVWAEDASTIGINGNSQSLSKVLIFCNRSNKVNELSTYLQEQGIKNIGLSSTSEHRKRGSNHHLDGFLRVREDKDGENANVEADRSSSDASNTLSDPKSYPHVMITTSLLSRGLDFSPSIRHVFIVDEPRNMIDFLHRAGRAGRAGEKGKVVVFGKLKGRGSTSAKDVRRKVGSLVAH